MATKFCSFCLSNDHYLRNKTIVTCPKLRLTQCNICYNFGHTTNFCKEKPEKPDKSEKPKTINSSVYAKPQSQIVKPKKNDFLAIASRFGALEVKESEFDNSSDYDCDDDCDDETETNTQEYCEEDDDELPPVSAIVWGKGFASNYKAKKWSD